MTFDALARHRWGFYTTHSDASQSVGLLWTSGQLVAETSTWQHTTLTTDGHPCPRWNLNCIWIGYFEKVTCAGTTCGLLELNSRITTFLNRCDVTSGLFQPSDIKEVRESTMTKKRRIPKKNLTFYLFEMSISFKDKCVRHSRHITFV
jgi:hypothetical protein